MEKNDILTNVNRYYTDKILQHGPTPAGVDWKSAESQDLRFAQLAKIIEPDNDTFSVLDYGCGFGSLYGFLQKYFQNFSFTGFDISGEMLKEAEKLYPSGPSIQWTNQTGSEKYDYLISSGIFNVKNAYSDADWLAYILDVLHQMDKLTTKGFSFNVLTSYSDEDKKRPDLYYADPLYIFDYCKRHFSKRVALLHDYPIYEFSILVRK
jgi:SAM-dependent methyltransferase